MNKWLLTRINTPTTFQQLSVTKNWLRYLVTHSSMFPQDNCSTTLIKQANFHVTHAKNWNFTPLCIMKLRLRTWDFISSFHEPSRENRGICTWVNQDGFHCTVIECIIKLFNNCPNISSFTLLNVFADEIVDGSHRTTGWTFGAVTQIENKLLTIWLTCISCNSWNSILSCWLRIWLLWRLLHMLSRSLLLSLLSTSILNIIPCIGSCSVSSRLNLCSSNTLPAISCKMAQSTTRIAVLVGLVGIAITFAFALRATFALSFSTFPPFSELFDFPSPLPFCCCLPLYLPLPFCSLPLCLPCSFLSVA